MAAWRSSGQTQAAFARERAVRLGTLRRWVYRSERTKIRGVKVDFREVKNVAGAWDSLVSPAVEIAVGPEITVRLRGSCGPEVIARLVEQLRRSC